MPTRILLHGCNGRMGRFISEASIGNADINIVAGIDINPKQIYEYPVFSSPEACTVDFDVMVDFSHPAALEGICRFSGKMNKAIVIATTGHTPAMKSFYIELSKTVPVFVSANMSIGINLLISLAKHATSILYKDFDIEIVESHHNQKLDAPSGTAVMIADAVNSSADNTLNYIYDRHSVREKRNKNQLGIHSVRGGSIVGDHTVIFAGNEEVIELTHRAQSRNVFAQGAIAAAVFIKDLPAGLYSMEDLIRSRSDNS